MKTFFAFLFVGLFGLSLQAQLSLSGGFSAIKPFGVSTFYPGFHLTGELFDDDVTTVYARVSVLPSRAGDSIFAAGQAIDFNTVPYTINIGGVERYNYTVLEFGKRYYFGEGYDAGFGAYGGSNMCIIFNKVSYRLDDYDENTYIASVDVSKPGSIVSLAFGLNAGLKNTMHFGTFYLDFGLNYSLFGIQSQNTQSTNSYSPLLFNFNLGFRKDFY